MSSTEQPRVDLRTDAGDDAELASIYSQVVATTGAIPKLYQVLAACPPLLQGWIDFAWALRSDARSSRALRELAILRTAYLKRSDYVWRSHARVAVKEGATEPQVAAVAAWPEGSESFDEATRAVLALTDEMVSSGAVSDATWDAVAAQCGQAECIEIVLTISWYEHVARIVATLGVPLEGYHARVPALPTALT